MGPPALEVSKNSVDVVMRDTCNGHGSDELMVGLHDLKDLF